MPNLNRISIDTVKRAANLAEEAANDRQRFLAGMRNIDLGDQESERGSRNPTDLDALNIVSPEASEAFDELRGFLDELTPDERIELRAVMLVGRGDFAGNQWDAALSDAGRAPDASHFEDIAEKIELHDFLMKGLYALDLLDKGDQ